MIFPKYLGIFTQTPYFPYFVRESDNMIENYNISEMHEILRKDVPRVIDALESESNKLDFLFCNGAWTSFMKDGLNRLYYTPLEGKSVSCRFHITSCNIMPDDENFFELYGDGFYGVLHIVDELNGFPNRNYWMTEKELREIQNVIRGEERLTTVNGESGWKFVRINDRKHIRVGSMDFEFDTIRVDKQWYMFIKDRNYAMFVTKKGDELK